MKHSLLLSHVLSFNVAGRRLAASLIGAGLVIGGSVLAPVTGSAFAAGLPGGPTNVMLTARPIGVAATWTAPTSTGGMPITGYVVRFKSEGNVPAVVDRGPLPSSVLMATLIDTSNTGPWAVLVAAVTPAGQGPFVAAPQTVAAANLGSIAAAAVKSSTAVSDQTRPTGDQVSGMGSQLAAYGSSIGATTNTAADAATQLTSLQLQAQQEVLNAEAQVQSARETQSQQAASRGSCEVPSRRGLRRRHHRIHHRVSGDFPPILSLRRACSRMGTRSSAHVPTVWADEPAREEQQGLDRPPAVDQLRARAISS